MEPLNGESWQMKERGYASAARVGFVVLRKIEPSF
jgi:hypothetical protein